jgi:hypothetical protein
MPVELPLLAAAVPTIDVIPAAKPSGISLPMAG